MKLFLLGLVLLATTATSLAKNVGIDWNTVKPIVYYRHFWDNKSPELRPPESFFKNYERQALEGRIVGGQIGIPHQFPYQVALLSDMPGGGAGFCGGSFIGTRTVLTAAHCIDNSTLQSGTTIFGAHFWRDQAEPNQRRFNYIASNVILHPSWNPLLIQNDVAVIQLSAEVPVNPLTIRPAILPTAAEANYDFANEDAVASGWGVFSQDNPVVSEVLRYVYDNVITIPQCTLSTIGVATAANICMTGTQNRGVCNGDSGGPLTVRRVVNPCMLESPASLWLAATIHYHPYLLEPLSS